MLTRREMLRTSALGFGSLALASLHAQRPHFAAKAKAVIQLVQNGGPSQMDLFDPKPELTRRAGQPHPDGVEIHQPGNLNTLLASPFEFHKYGQSGMDVSDALPHTAAIVDELGFVRS